MLAYSSKSCRTTVHTNIMQFKFGLLFAMVVMFACAVLGRPAEDLEEAATGHGGGGGGGYGRVQIKVYRGPTEHDGHEHFAPYGFWVKQPADDGGHHH